MDRIDAIDWDLLIILDACRYDTLASIADSVVVERAVSPACNTGEFLRAANKNAVFDGATYISANPMVENYSPGDVTLNRVYKQERDEYLRTHPPKAVYNAAREALADCDRVVAHTVQPHAPHVAEYGGDIHPVMQGLHPANYDYEVRGENSITLPAAMLRYISDRQTMRQAQQSYEACARFAWDRGFEFATEAVADGHTVLITADHGELLGEWGLVGHPGGVRVAELVNVPWVVLCPRPETPETDRKSEHDLEAQLVDLGYKPD
jgi:hypothetical protein